MTCNTSTTAFFDLGNVLFLLLRGEGAGDPSRANTTKSVNEMLSKPSLFERAYADDNMCRCERLKYQFELLDNGEVVQVPPTGSGS